MNLTEVKVFARERQMEGRRSVRREYGWQQGLGTSQRSNLFAICNDPFDVTLEMVKHVRSQKYSCEAKC